MAGASASARDQALEAAKAIWKAKQQVQLQQPSQPATASVESDAAQLKAPTARASKPKKRPVDEVSTAVEENNSSVGSSVATTTATAAAETDRPQVAVEADGTIVDTAFVAGLPPHAEPEDLAQIFSAVGPIDSVRIVPERCFAFVRFQAPDIETARAFVDASIEQLNNTPYVHGSHRLRVSRARPARRDHQQQQQQQLGGSSTATGRDWVDHDAHDGKDMYAATTVDLESRSYIASTTTTTTTGEQMDDAAPVVKKAAIDWGFDDE